MPCVTDGASNCYTNTVAKSAGKAIVAGVLYSWDGTAWASGSSYLIDDRNSKISETTTLDKKWGTLGALTISGKASNNLYYDIGNTDNTRPNAILLCSNKGMRLPHYDETTAYGASLVPSYIGYTWTDFDNPGVGYFVWNGASAAWQPSSLDRDYIRCVY